MCTLELPENMTEEDWQRIKKVYEIKDDESNKNTEPLFQEEVFVKLSRNETKNVFRLAPSTQYIQ